MHATIPVEIALKVFFASLVLASDRYLRVPRTASAEQVLSPKKIPMKMSPIFNHTGIPVGTPYTESWSRDER